MLWAAVMALVIERRFLRASAWMAASAVFAAIGIIHAWRLTDAGIEGRIGLGAAPEFALSYFAGALFLLACAWFTSRNPAPRDVPVTETIEA